MQEIAIAVMEQRTSRLTAYTYMCEGVVVVPLPTN
jgi:hypothetical protein